MLEAGLWAALGQSALLVGALMVARFPKLTEPRWLGLEMAFGSHDKYIPAADVDREQARLAAAGLTPRIHRFDGGHRVDGSTLASLTKEAE